MAKFNADAESLFEAIEIELEGKIYTVKKVTPEVLEKVEEIAKQTGKKSADLLCEQLCIFLGGEPADYRHIDLRKIGAILQYILKELTENPGIAKNG